MPLLAENLSFSWPDAMLLTARSLTGPGFYHILWSPNTDNSSKFNPSQLSAPISGEIPSTEGERSFPPPTPVSTWAKIPFGMLSESG